MRRALILLVAVGAFAIVVVATAPASLAGIAVARASNGFLTLAETDGTIWRGRGTLAAARVFRLPLAWSIEPWPLLRGELRLHVFPSTPAFAAPRAEIAARRDSIMLRDLDVTLPADAVEGMAPRSGIHVSGEVRVATPSLDWTPATFTGGARVDWQDAQFGIAIDPGIRLGTVTAMLTSAGDRLTGSITNVGGAFEVRGTLSLAANGAPNVSIAMTPRGGDPAQARTLTVAGDPGGNLSVDFRMGTP